MLSEWRTAWSKIQRRLTSPDRYRHLTALTDRSRPRICFAESDKSIIPFTIKRRRFVLAAAVVADISNSIKFGAMDTEKDLKGSASNATDVAVAESTALGVSNEEFREYTELNEIFQGARLSKVTRKIEYVERLSLPMLTLTI